MKLKINFVLKAGIAGETPIIAIINYGYKEFDAIKEKFVYKPLKYYTGIKVQPNEWDDINKLPTEKSKQTILLQVEKTIREVFQYLQMNNNVDNNSIKNQLDVRLKGKTDEIVTKVRLVDFVNQFLVGSKTLSKKSKERYASFANRIEAFEKIIHKPLYSNDVNEVLYAQFMEEARKTLKRQNSIWLLFADFRVMMRRIAKQYKIDVFVPTSEISSNDTVRFKFEEKVYLNFDHIQKVIEYKPETDRMRNTKLIFLTLLFTGCRYSDVFKVIPEYKFSKDGIAFDYARFITQKKDTEVIVPILKPLKDALAENGGVISHRYTEVAFNLNVKELIRLCKIEEEITLTYTDSRGKKQFETKPFYKFVSSHTGRRSFITNLINYIPVTILTKITSHKLNDSSIIFGYNKISLLDNAVMFVRELKRIQADQKDHFKFKLI